MVIQLSISIPKSTDNLFTSHAHHHVTLNNSLKGIVSILPSHQLLWFLASIYLDPGFEPLFYPLGQRVGSRKGPPYIDSFFPRPFYLSRGVHVYYSIITYLAFSKVPVNRDFMCVNFMSSNAMNFFSVLRHYF